MTGGNRRFVGLTGTTCVGKSSVAVGLAKMLDTFVISADSMQVYKGMDVGTAKITSEEMHGVLHCMLDVVEPNVNFSAFDYVSMTSQLIENAQKPPIVCGGTGFYFYSLLFPSEFETGTSKRRAELQTIAKMPDGLQILTDMLMKLDEKSAEKIDLRNPVRVMRAIEIAECGGSLSNGVGRNRKPQFDCQIFVLQRDRAELYRMIDKRVDEMISKGLIDEAYSLIEKYGYSETTAFSAIGYKELFDYFKGLCSVQEAIDRIKINTRHYAKRQITYFKRLPNTLYIDVDGKKTEEVVDEIATKTDK